jgi:hypothetical protein
MKPVAARTVYENDAVEFVPMKKVAGILRSHEALLLNRCKARKLLGPAKGTIFAKSCQRVHVQVRESKDHGFNSVTNIRLPGRRTTVAR